MKIEKIKILNKINLLPDIFTRYPSFLFFHKLSYKNTKINFLDTKYWNLLYIHIPFCLSICNFCNLYKVPFKNNKETSTYVDILINELIEKSKKIKWNISGIWIWWGTPNIISDKDTLKLFNIIFTYFEISKDINFEIDIHPTFITENKIKIYKDFWVNLLSVWIQSFDTSILKKSNRENQNKIKINEKLKILNNFNIDIHIDIIVWLPWDNLNIDYKKIDYLFKNIKIFSTSVNKYENSINTNFYKNWYREEVNYSKLEKVSELEKYIYDNFQVRREKSFFIKHFFTSRYNVISCWSGAFWYIRNFWVYRNELYSEYIKSSNNIKLFKFDDIDDKIMYILNNWDIEYISFLYKEQYWTYMYNDFSDFFENLDKRYYKNITDNHIRFLFKSDYIAKYKLIDLYFDKISN